MNKPRGITSFGVISRLRRLTGIRRIGHTGTLDPFAEGLLVVCIGRSTAIVQFMDDYNKTYRLGIVFGRATDTQDLSGETIFEHDLTADEMDQLRQTGFARYNGAVQAMTGERCQTPPMYSAVKVDGRPLYEYARRGQEVERKSRLIRVYSAETESISLEGGQLRASLVISCSKGTYIRTLADDLGRELGFGAHADTLIRLRCGPFSLDQASSLEQLQVWRDDCTDQAAFLNLLRENGRLLPIDRAFAGFPALDLPEQEAIKLINGQPTWLLPDELATRWRNDQVSPTPVGSADPPVVIYSRGRLIAVAHLLEPTSVGRQLKTERVLVDLADFRQS